MTLNNASQPVVLLFSGQGNPVIGMGSDLWDLNSTTKQIWDCASDISGLDLRRLCLKGPMNRLIQTTVQQLAVTAINVSLYTLCRERFPALRVTGACGHSVGNTVRFTLRVRSRWRRFSAPSIFAPAPWMRSAKAEGRDDCAEGADFAALSNIITRYGFELDISCDNTPRQQVIGGTPAALSEFAKVLVDEGYEPIKLGVSGAWHTRLMEEGVQLMRDFLAGQPFTSPAYDVLMNVTGKIEIVPEAIKENLSLHLTHTVKWRESMTRFIEQPGSPLFLEMSNKPYLGQMLNDFVGFNAERVLHCRKALEM